MINFHLIRCIKVGARIIIYMRDMHFVYVQHAKSRLVCNTCTHSYNIIILYNESLHVRHTKKKKKHISTKLLEISRLKSLIYIVLAAMYIIIINHTIQVFYMPHA